MSKRSPGLPPNFTMDVPTSAPVKLAEFLDEMAGEHAAVATAPQPIQAAPQRPVVRQEEPAEEAPERPRPMVRQASRPAPLAAVTRARFRTAALPPSKPIRVQLNMTPSVSKMLDELVHHFCTYGVQKDTTASEIFEGLVAALYESRDQLNLGNLPPRGQWGSASAQAFRTHIRNAVAEAIAVQRQSAE